VHLARTEEGLTCKVSIAIYKESRLLPAFLCAHEKRCPVDGALRKKSAATKKGGKRQSLIKVRPGESG
jgi:hypothetical protein